MPDLLLASTADFDEYLKEANKRSEHLSPRRMKEDKEAFNLDSIDVRFLCFFCQDTMISGSTAILFNLIYHFIGYRALEDSISLLSHTGMKLCFRIV